ncbi:MAG: hypothetical protein IJX65_06300 [Alistipes sp.]|nr:hypothetical protein [Alistipes sp.]
MFSIVYTQRTNSRIVVCNTSIGVEGEGQIHRNTQPLLLLKALRATHKGIYPLTTTLVVVVVVVTVVVLNIYTTIKARPL